MKKFFPRVLSILMIVFMQAVISQSATLLPTSNAPLPQWKAPPFMGKDFWVWLNHPERYAEQMQKVLTEPMTQNTVKSFSLGTSLFERNKPLYNRLLIREITFYDGKRKVAAKAKVDAWAEHAEIKYLQRIYDGDDSAQSACFSAPALAGKDQVGWFSFTFDKAQRIDKVVVHSGRARVEGASDHVHLASRFVLQAHIDGEWQDLPETARKNNLDPAIAVSFKAVRSTAFRLYVYEQTTPLVVSGKLLFEREFPSDVPFSVSARASRPPFNCFEDCLYDSSGYQEWKEKHPNFIGFDVATEWDNEYINYLCFPADLDQTMNRLGCSNTVKKKVREKIYHPKDRQAALSGLHTYYQAIRKHFFDDTDKMMFFDCLMAFNHYAMEWGGGIATIETTSSGSHRHQPQMMFARGASRQYRKAWSWYVALGYNGRDENGKVVYTDPEYTGFRSGGPDWGISTSLNMRDRYVAYFSGANHLRCEVWPFAYCQDKDGDGIWELSPHGEVMKEWDAFVRNNPRGYSYAPVALCLPFDHGQSPILGGKIWGRVNAERSDHQVEACLRTLVPWNAHRGGQEWAYSNSPYGDLYDIILPETPKGAASLEVLNLYKVLFFAGNTGSSPEFVKRMHEYVEQGGTIVLNVKQLNPHFTEEFLGARLTGQRHVVQSPVKSLLDDSLISLPQKYSLDEIEMCGGQPILLDAQQRVVACLRNHGKGRVILTSTDYLMPDDIGNLNTPTHSKWHRGQPEFPLLQYLFARITSEILPFKIDGDIQFGLNQMPDGWLVYLINNEGIFKTIKEAQRIDPEKTSEVTLNLSHLPVVSVRELRSGQEVSPQTANNRYSFAVAPGDVRVLRVVCK
jgi:hypothetical protein